MCESVQGSHGGASARKARRMVSCSPVVGWGKRGLRSPRTYVMLGVGGLRVVLLDLIDQAVAAARAVGAILLASGRGTSSSSRLGGRVALLVERRAAGGRRRCRDGRRRRRVHSEGGGGRTERFRDRARAEDGDGDGCWGGEGRSRRRRARSGSGGVRCRAGPALIGWGARRTARRRGESASRQVLESVERAERAEERVTDVGPSRRGGGVATWFWRG